MKRSRRLEILEAIRDRAFYVSPNKHKGICSILTDLYFYNYMNREEYYYIQKYLKDRYPIPSWDIATHEMKYGYGTGFIWQPGLAEPRVLFIEKLIEENRSIWSKIFKLKWS